MLESALADVTTRYTLPQTANSTPVVLSPSVCNRVKKGGLADKVDV
jgi:hypothetical protein